VSSGGVTYLDPSGWRVTYSGGRLADLIGPDGAPVDCVQVRPWDFTRNPAEQDPHTVTAEDLAAALADYRGQVLDGGTGE
jgi:hypothetical protein